MAFSKHSTTSLLTEHFTYTPLTLIDDIIDTVNALLYTNIAGIETALLSVSPVTLGFEKRALAEKASASASSRPASTLTNGGSKDAAAVAEAGKDGKDEDEEKDENGNPLYAHASREIEEGVQKLETLLEAGVDRNFDKLEIVALRTVLNVPEGVEGWVRLGHYEGLTFPPPSSSSSSAAAPTPESLHRLRRKLQETRKLHAALQAERARNAALLAQLRGLLPASDRSLSSLSSSSVPQTHMHMPNTAPKAEDARTGATKRSFGFLANADAARELGVRLDGGYAGGRDGAVQKREREDERKHEGQQERQQERGRSETEPQNPLTTHTTSLLAQIPALHALLTDLRPRLTSLGSGSAKADSGEAGRRRRERGMYVEERVRRGLERRGVLGEGAEEATGMGMGRGRRVGAEEVRSLEGILELLRGKRAGEWRGQREGEGEGEGEEMEMEGEGEEEMEVEVEEQRAEGNGEDMDVMGNGEEMDM